MKQVLLQNLIVKKVKFTLEQTMEAQRENRGIAVIFLNLRTRLGWVDTSTPQSPYPQHPLYRNWVGHRAGLDGCGKSRLPTGFDRRTVQPVASRYTDCAIPAHKPNIISAS